MRFYTKQHTYYCGVDLHANTMYLCVLNEAGEILLQRNIPAQPQAFLHSIAQYREQLVVGVECIYCWYWLADLCRAEAIEIVLGHALYLKAIHGGKAKNDKLDSEKLARLLRGGAFPMSYVYPREMRSTRDLMRRRLFFVNKRAELMAHVQMTHHQYNLPAPGKKIAYRANRENLELAFDDESAKRMVESDLTMIDSYSEEIRKLEWFIEKQGKAAVNNAQALSLLKSVPGIGDVLSLTLLYEIENIERFPSVQKFCAYARLGRPEKTSAGKSAGGGGKKIGNPHLKWAFSEAAALMLRSSPEAKQYKERLERQYGKPKAMSLLAHRLGKAVYFMMLRGKPFDQHKFFAQ